MRQLSFPVRWNSNFSVSHVIFCEQKLRTNHFVLLEIVKLANLQKDFVRFYARSSTSTSSLIIIISLGTCHAQNSPPAPASSIIHHFVSHHKDGPLFGCDPRCFRHTIQHCIIALSFSSDEGALPALTPLNHTCIHPHEMFYVSLTKTRRLLRNRNRHSLSSGAYSSLDSKISFGVIS